MSRDEVKTRSKSLKAQREKDQTKVKGIFRFYEVPGGRLKFTYKKYKEDGLQNYELVDNHQYELPLGVAKHLNKNGWYPEHQHLLDEAGNAKVALRRKVHRFGFQSLEFTDDEDLTTDNPSDRIFTPEEPLIAQL